MIPSVFGFKTHPISIYWGGGHKSNVCVILLSDVLVFIYYFLVNFVRGGSSAGFGKGKGKYRSRFDLVPPPPMHIPFVWLFSL